MSAVFDWSENLKQNYLLGKKSILFRYFLISQWIFTLSRNNLETFFFMASVQHNTIPICTMSMKSVSRFFPVIITSFQKKYYTVFTLYVYVHQPLKFVVTFCECTFYEPVINKRKGIFYLHRGSSILSIGLLGNKMWRLWIHP